jgi:hypothetical protein
MDILQIENIFVSFSFFIFFTKIKVAFYNWQVFFTVEQFKGRNKNKNSVFKNLEKVSNGNLYLRIKPSNICF